MGVSADSVPDESNVDDSQSEVAGDRAVMLYKISDASGSLAVSEVSGMPLTQDMLNPEVIIQLISAQKYTVHRKMVISPYQGIASSLK